MSSKAELAPSPQEGLENENEDSPIVLVGPKNYYAILGLEHGASEAEVKKDYSLFKSFYEKNKHNRAFDEKKEAYEVLLDRDRRIIYDMQLGVFRDVEALLNKYVIPANSKAAVINWLQSTLNEFSAEFESRTSQWVSGNMVAKRYLRIDLQKFSNEFGGEILRLIPEVVQDNGGTVRKNSPQKPKNLPVAQHVKPVVFAKQENDSDLNVSTDTDPEIDLSLDADEVDEPGTVAPTPETSEPQEENNEFEDALMTPDIVQEHVDSQKVAEFAPKSLVDKRKQLEGLYDMLAEYAHDGNGKDVVEHQIALLSADIANHENIEYRKKTGKDINKEVERKFPAGLKEAAEKGKPVLSLEEYRQERLAKEEEYIKGQDRREAEDILRNHIKSKLPKLTNEVRARFFDKRGDLMEDAFQKYFKIKVSESGVSEASFCKMLSMGYRLDLFDDVKGFWQTVGSVGAKKVLPTEGGLPMYYHTEGQIDGLRDTAIKQEEVIKKEAERRVAIPLYHQDGSAITKEEIEAGFVNEEMTRAQDAYWKILVENGMEGRFFKADFKSKGPLFLAHLERIRSEKGLSREAFYAMINMGYSIESSVKYPKSFNEWIEKKARIDIRNETTARLGVVDKYKPHHENRELVKEKIRGRLLEKAHKT